MQGQRITLDINLVSYDPHQGENFVISRHYPYADFDHVIEQLKLRGYESYIEDKHITACDCRELWLSVKNVQS